MSAVAARPASLATNARLALVGDVASKAAQLGVMVLAARLLSTRELAVFGICLTLATVLTVALDAGVSTVLVRECASRPRRGWASAAAAFRGRLLLALAAVAACTAGGFAFRRPVDALLVAALAILGATALTLYAVFRAGQTLETEAEQKLTESTAALEKSKQELASAKSNQETAETKLKAAQDVMWVLFNTKELLFNH